VCVFGRVVGGVDVGGLWWEEEERKEEGEAGDVEVEEEGGEVVVEERERESQDPEPEVEVDGCGVVLVFVVIGENGEDANPNAAEKAFESAELLRRVGAGGCSGEEDICAWS